MRSTARIAVVFLIFGTILTLVPLSLALVVLPLRLLGSVLLLVGFRLVLGSRIDDIPAYRGKAWLSPIMYGAYLLLYPLAGLFLVLSFVKADSSVWRVLFFVTLGLMGAAYSLSFMLFQMPLRKGLGKAVLVAVAILSLLLMAVLPPLSGAPSSYAADRAGSALDRLRLRIDDKLQAKNATFDFDATNMSDIENASASEFARYVIALLLNPIINETRNVTGEVLWTVRNATVVFIAVSAPVILFDLGHSLATLLWAFILPGTIVTMGRLEQEQRREAERADEEDGDEESNPPPGDETISEPEPNNIDEGLRDPEAVAEPSLAPPPPDE